MKTPFQKLRGLGLIRHDKRDRHNTQQLDELSQASQDMEDMKGCYDGLLSAAAGTANSAYEFSESLREMGGCLLEKTALNDDEDSGRVLLMLGKVQFEIQKLLDNYRSHISRTITVPSESLLNELHIVEEMKKQCDAKRMSYEEMKIKHKDKVKTKSSKGEYVSSRQLQAARDEFDEDATLFIFRMKSLKRGQSRSLLTQAARHYAAQMSLFRKALESLEAIEPHVKLTAEQQHIDYPFGGLEDDDRDSVLLTDNEDAQDDSDDDLEPPEDSELSFDLRRNNRKNEASSSGNSMELDNEHLTFSQTVPENSPQASTDRNPVWNSTKFEKDLGTGTKSAPLSSERNLDPNEQFRQTRQSSVRKLNTYVLPTPLQKSTISPFSATQPKPMINMWHSSPLEHKKHDNEKYSGPMGSSTKLVLKESNKNSKPTPLPPPLKQSASSAKKVKRYAISGPLTGNHSQPNKAQLYASGPIGSTGHTQLFSGSPFHTPKLSSFGDGFVSSPKISELHELPRPPPPHTASNKPSNVGFSAPLATLKRGSDVMATADGVVSPPIFLKNG